MPRWLIVAASALALAACAKPTSTPTPYDTSISTHDLMTDVVEPNADAVWHASGAIVDFQGEHDLSPTTDAGWADVRGHAAVIAEAGNLLLLPGRMRPGPTWTAKAHALTELGLEAVKAAKTKDKDAMLRIGGELDGVCDECHEVYVEGQPGKP